MPTVRVCLQWTAVIFNAFTLLIGSLAALACVYEYIYRMEEGSAENIQFNKLLQLAMAGTLILSAIIGCSGAFLGSIKVLVVHAVLMVLLIAAHIWRLVHFNDSKLMDATEEFVMGVWLKELVHPTSMQQLQRRYECCGDKGYADYTSLGMKVPQSCFHTKDGLHALYPYAEGCMVAVKRGHQRIYNYEKLIHGGLIGYEIVCIVLAITLCCQLTTKTRRYTY